VSKLHLLWTVWVWWDITPRLPSIALVTDALDASHLLCISSFGCCVSVQRSWRWSPDTEDRQTLTRCWDLGSLFFQHTFSRPSLALCTAARTIRLLWLVESASDALRSLFELYVYSCDVQAGR